MEHHVSEPVTLMPFQLIVPGEAAPGAPIRDFRPQVRPADAPDEKPLANAEGGPSDEIEDGGEGEDPKGGTVTVSADSSKKTDDSPKAASPSPEEKSASAVTAASASKPVVPSPPTSSSATKAG